MPSTSAWGRQVIAVAEAPMRNPVTIEGQPMEEFVRNEQALQKQGETQLMTDEGTPFDPNLFLSEDPQRKLFEENPRQAISNNYAWNQGNIDALLVGDPDSTGGRAQAYATDQTVQDAAIEQLMGYYSEDHIDYGVLENLEGLEPSEQLARIEQEVNRLNANTLDTKFQLTIHMLRSGHGNQPVKFRDEAYMDMSTSDLAALGDNMRTQQREQLQIDLAKVVAPLGEGLTEDFGKGMITDVVQQDFIPVYGAVTRIGTSQAFLPEDVQMGWFRDKLPGEVQQEIREWWVSDSTTHEDRVKYISDIKTEVEKLSKGPHAAHFTRYGILEQVVGIFTDELMYNENPKDTLGRVLGNLDVVLELTYALGVVAKTGSTVNQMYRANNSLAARNAARAAGNHDSVARIDYSLRQTADALDLTPAEASVVDLARPISEIDNLEVLPDGVKQVINETSAVRRIMLSDTDDMSSLGLNKADKDNAVRKQIESLDWGDSVHVNHRMMTIEPFENDTGYRLTAVVGRTPDSGWDDFGDLVDELKVLDPNLNEFEIVKRGPNGTITPVGVTADDIGRYVTKGIVPDAIDDAQSATSSVFGGRKLSQVSKDELLAPPLTPKTPQSEVNKILKEIERRKEATDSSDPLKALDGDEYFLRMSQDKYYHSMDKGEFADKSFLSAGMRAERGLVPNSQFGPDIFPPNERAYRVNQGLQARFTDLYNPFYKLSSGDQVVVQKVFEWAENFAKEQHTTGVARSPTYEEIIANFDNLTDAQLQGYASVREGLKIQHQLLNRMVYRDGINRNFKTARGLNPDRPNYHGNEIVEGEAKPGMYFDPEANEMVNLAKDSDVQDIYNGGGTFIKLEFPIDGPDGGKFDRVIVRSGDYELGEFSRSPLNYYEGYYNRFYEDPYYVIMHIDKAVVNGVEQKQTITEAIRTAGSSPEAINYVKKYSDSTVLDNGRYQNSKDPRISYEIRAAKDVNNVEGPLLQQQSMHKEGRIFFDKRNYDRLPDVNGNRAKIQDLNLALQKGTAMATRTVTTEELMKTMTNGFRNQFGDIEGLSTLLNTGNISSVIKHLESLKANATVPAYRGRLSEALQLARYLRVQLGYDSAWIPAIRETQIKVGNWVARAGVEKDMKSLSRFGGWIEKRGQSTDPFRAMKSLAYNTFMVATPGRQLLLQSGQISFLTPYAPKYIASGKVFVDSVALRRGLRERVIEGYQDGFTNAKMAKVMGLSKKEYSRLVEELDRSGLMSMPGVHAFKPNPNAAKGARLRDSAAGHGWHKLRTGGSKVMDAFRWGFDAGERNNLSMTYMIALRKALKEKNVPSLTAFTRQEWDDIALDASNLALGMSKPNKAWYQSGAPGVPTQFISFTHKAGLALLRQNPSISVEKASQIMAVGYLMWGANFFGAEDYSRQLLSSIGLSNRAMDEVLAGVSLQDFLAGGLIESGFNALAEATFGDDYNSLDISSFAPGVDVSRVYDNFYRAIMDKPGTLDLNILLGPSSRPAGGFLTGAAWVSRYFTESEDPPGTKFLRAAEILGSHTVPAWNNANKALIAKKMGEWLDADGDTLPMQPVAGTMIARGFLGIKSDEEIAYQHIRSEMYTAKKNMDNAVEANKEYLKIYLTSYRNNVINSETVLEQFGVLADLLEDWPEGARHEIFKRSLTDGDYSNPPILDMLLDISKNGGASMTDLLPWIDMSESLTLEQKETMRQLVKDGEVNAQSRDRKFNQYLEDNNVREAD